MTGREIIIYIPSNNLEDETQAYANKKLQAQGYLFLNDVLEMLGIQKTKAGQFGG